MAAAQQQVNLTAGPATADPARWLSGADVGLQLRRRRQLAPPQPAPRRIQQRAGWSPVVITVPTGQDPHHQPDQQPLVSARTTVPTSLMIVGQLGGGLGQPRRTGLTAPPDHSNAQAQRHLAHRWRGRAARLPRRDRACSRSPRKWRRARQRH